ncbi:hypothetical protein MCC93_07890 [Morococcus cerebrosus]|uniref:Uncharacterized protein n=1 Tax=Morococcus cerebrosus TaxID=1056807 RepID=A0A0C1H7V9_9NEIS|nr:hypothetical protein MCC93_07890 [Morococcus cerebrosus]
MFPDDFIRPVWAKVSSVHPPHSAIWWHKGRLKRFSDDLF